MRTCLQLSFLVLFASLPVVAGATDLRIRAAEIVGYGIFESTSRERTSSFTRSALPADAVRGVEFVEFTNEVPAELGTDFGFQYVINSTPKGRPVEVVNVIKFPGDGLHAPGGRVYKESRERSRVIMGKETLYGYGFDYEWEMVTGEWVFEVWHGKAPLIRKRFTVVDPATTDDGE